jgi:dolichol-phosphate mannosyltransferase
MADQAAIYVITATYNERDNIAPLHQGLRAALPEAHLVVVDDNSPDGTVEAVRELQAHDPRVHLLERPGKLGYASAHQDGMRYALERGADLVVTMDADLSHDPGVIPSMVAALGEHDLVIGSRYAPGGGFEGVGVTRRALSRFANGYVRFVLGLSPRECTSGFRAYRAETIERAGLLEPGPEGYVFLTEAVWRCTRTGASIGEVPITYTVRERGKSKMSLGIIAEAAWRPLVLRLATLFRPRAVS